MAFQGRGTGAPNIIKQLKSPNNNLREHLHTQGRTRAQNQTLDAGPAGSLGNHQRGGSLNIQDLYSHYQKRSISGSSQQGLKGRNQQGRNVTYYSNKNTGGPAQFQNFNGQMDGTLQAHHNNYVQHGP